VRIEAHDIGLANRYDHTKLAMGLQQDLPTPLRPAIVARPKEGPSR
jgi:hypothetical protein